MMLQRLAILLLVCILVHSEKDENLFKLTGFIPTLAASGMTFWSSQTRRYLLVSNFMAYVPGEDQPTPKAASILYEVYLEGVGFKGKQLQSISTEGAIKAAALDNIVVIPNFYGEHVEVHFLKETEDSAKLHPAQKVPSNGATAVELFKLGTKTWLAVAELKTEEIALYELHVGFEQFVPKYKLPAPGVTGMSSLFLPDTDEVLFFTASHDSFGSHVFVYDGDEFEHIDSIHAKGARDVESIVTKDGRIFAFFACDKDEDNRLVPDSTLYEWMEDEEEFLAVDTVPTEGAHGAEFFQDAKGDFYLLVANYGNRVTQEIDRKSPVFKLDLDSDKEASLQRIHEFETNRAMGWTAFAIGDRTFVTVSQESKPAESENSIKSPVYELVLTQTETGRDEL